MAPLSRVQLAAALIEYDNDDPYAGEPRFARDSAILANFKSSAPRNRGSRRQRTRPPSEAFAEGNRVDASGGHRAGKSSPPPSAGNDGNRRSWATVPESQPVAERPVSPPDFRRSASPFMKEIMPVDASTPVSQELKNDGPPLTTQTSATGEASSQITLLSPAPQVGKQVLPPHAQQPTSSNRPQLAAPIPKKASAAPFSASTSSAIESSAPTLLSSGRPFSGQASQSFALASPPLSSRPLPDALSSTRSPSSASIPLQPPSRSSSVPLEMQLHDQSMSLFAVPYFETLASPPRTKTARRRSKSPFRFLSPKASPSASLAILPDELALRDAISALPRSLGGDPPSGDHRRGMGPRARTGSMGDWEDLVFQQQDGFQSDTSLSGLRSFGSRSAAASQVFFEDDDEDGGLVGAASGAVYGPDGAIAKKSRSQSVDALSIGGANGIVRRTTPKGVPAPSKPVFEISNFNQPTSSAALPPNAAPAAAAGLHHSIGSKSPALVAHALPEPAARQESRPAPPALIGMDRRPSVASSFDMVSSTSSGRGQTPPLQQYEPEPPFVDQVPAVETRGSIDTRPSSSRGDREATSSGYSAAEAVDSQPTVRPESSLSLLDEIGRMTPGLLADPATGRDAVEETRRSLRQSRLSRHTDRDGTDVEYLAENDVERERERWLPPTSNSRASRFDPANSRSRKTSIHGPSDEEEADDEDDARRRPGKPKGATRPHSLAHFKQSGRLATSATSSIYLPPVLVMPALLDPSAHEEGQPVKPRGFFQTAAKPLPIDFKSRPPLHTSRSSSSFIASASALAVPVRSLTLAQKTFRASLVVDGKRGGDFLGSALEEGDKAFDENDEDDASDHWMIRPDDEYRGPGTLYGRSLMDTLELRKQELANKKRTFRGDSRPAMFTRSATEATFPSAPSVRGRPQSVYPNPTFPADGDAASVRAPGMSQRASVFGLDKHWQDAMAEREEEDRRLAEIDRRREEAEETARAAAEAKRASKQKGKRRMSGMLSSRSLAQAAEHPPSPPEAQAAAAAVDDVDSPDEPRAAALPPSISLGELATGDAIQDMFSDDEHGHRSALRPEQRSSRVVSRAGWESSDEDDGEGRPRRKKQPISVKSFVQPLPKILATRDDTSSDEDVPLAAHYNLPSLRTNARPSSFFYRAPESAVVGSSDEELPLSQLIHGRTNDASGNGGSGAPGNPPAVPKLAGEDDDDDDVPLGVRHSTYQQPQPDEDDVPLGLSQAQHLQQQYYQQQAAAAQQAQMFLIQQQQQQQMAMHQQRMMMAAAYGGMGGYGGPMPSAMQAPSLHAPKDDKIARWREEVPIE